MSTETLRPIEGPEVEWKGDDGTTDVTGAALGSTASGSFGEAIDTQEKLIGENNLRPVAFLETGVQRSRAVARLTLPGRGVATGFMIGPDRLLTNNHVFGNAQEAEGATVAVQLSDRSGRSAAGHR